MARWIKRRPSGQRGDSRRRAAENLQQNNMRSLREQMLYLVVFVMFIAISAFVDRNSAVQQTAAFLVPENGWTLETGETADMDALPRGVHTLTADVGGLQTARKSLCLKSIDTTFSVYADGELIYDYHPVIPERLGASYGMYVHTVPLPENAAQLSLRLEPVFSNTPAALHDVMIGDGGQYMTNLFRGNLTAFGRSSVTLIIGLLFLAIGLFSKILMRTAGIDFISFGMLCAIIGFTGFNDTLLLQVLTRHPALIRVVTYVCLIFLPFPAVSFFASATGRSHSRLVSSMLTLCIANFAAQVLLTHRGVTDYFHLVYVSHGIIGLAFAVSAYLVVQAVRRRDIAKDLLRCLIVGLSACAVGVVLDILRFYFFHTYGASDFTRFGMLLFMLMMGVYLFRAQIRALKRKHQESVALIGEISEAFAKVIDMKDSYTNGHSSRVAKYTAMLARELGYDEETAERYYRIALLHDVGKIGIPKAVLNKPGKLTRAEYEIIKSHTIKGYDVLKDISIMPELATGARSHHERPDGKGYPNGLSGDEIPRVAQIIAVADCFDAMYSNRPYRSRMNFDKVVSIIRQVSGTQLMPDVVDAFLRLVEKGQFRDPNDHGGGATENIDNMHSI